MIDILYRTGNTVWRASAIEVFTIGITQPDKKDEKKTISINGIACVREDDRVFVFYKSGISREDCNDIIAMAVNELDLRNFELFGIHNKAEFMEMRDADKANSLDFEKDGNITPVPIAKTRDEKKSTKSKKK